MSLREVGGGGGQCLKAKHLKFPFWLSDIPPLTHLDVGHGHHRHQEQDEPDYHLHR